MTVEFFETIQLTSYWQLSLTVPRTKENNSAAKTLDRQPTLMKWEDIIRIRFPEPEEIAEKERQKQLAEELRVKSGEKDLNDLQTKVADCFLNSWIFALSKALKSGSST